MKTFTVFIRVAFIFLTLTLFACSGGSGGKDNLQDTTGPATENISEGGSCSADAECKEELLCLNGKCTMPGTGKEGEACQTDVECSIEFSCLNGICAKASDEGTDQDNSSQAGKVALKLSKPENGIVTSLDAAINCGDDCTETYDIGKEVALTAKPDDWYNFDGWSGDCSGKELSITIKMDAAKKCSASFSNIVGHIFELKNILNGNITSSPEGIACGYEGVGCLKKFPENEQITLTAEPKAGYQFGGWTGDCAGGNPLTLKMTSEKSCSATFSKMEALTGKLIVQKIGKGTVKTSDEFMCDTEGMCEKLYDYKMILQLLAIPAEGYKFDSWTGACAGTDIVSSITIEGPTTCTAVFSKLQYKLNITKPQGGIIVSQPAGIACGTSSEDCETLIDHGTEVKLTATADAGYQFDSWLEGCSGNSFTMTAAKSCAAKFSKKAGTQYSLTIQKVGNGTVRSNPIVESTSVIDCGTICSLSFDKESFVKLITLPDDGYKFISWGGDCLKGEISVNVPKTCIAVFQKEQHSLNIDKKEGGTVISTPTGISCGSGGEACNGIYDFGTNITLTATADAGYVFDSWAGACGGDISNVAVTMSANTNCYAVFKKLYTISINKMGNGLVISDPAGINCGDSCSAIYKDMTNVTLTATPDAGWKLQSFISGTTGNTTTVTMGEDKFYNVFFAAVQPSEPPKPEPTPAEPPKPAEPAVVRYKLTFASYPSADSYKIMPSPAGTICGTNCYEYDSGTMVTLTATTDYTDEEVKSWSNDCSGTSSTTSVTMNSNKNCRVNFGTKQLGKQKLTVIKDGSGCDVTSDPSGISCGQDCEEEYSVGATIKLIVSACGVASFGGWSGNCSGSDNTATVTMNGGAVKTCVAKLVSNNFKLTLSNVIGGSIAATPTQTSTGYPKGTVVTLKATAYSGYSFKSWSGACATAGTNNTATITMDADKECSAVFSPMQYKLTVVKEAGGNGTVTSGDGKIACGSTCSAIYNYNSDVTLTAVPNPDSDFVAWANLSGNTWANLSGDATTTIKLDTTLRAQFTLKPVTLTITKQGNGTVMGAGGKINCGQSCSATFDPGYTVALTATADPGWKFNKWLGDCVNGYVKMSSDKACTAIFVEDKITEKPKFTLTVTNQYKPDEVIITSNDGSLNCGSACSGFFEAGAIVELMAKALKPNMVFNSWKGDCAGLDKISFPINLLINSNKSCKPIFDKYYNLAITQPEGGIISCLLPGGDFVSCPSVHKEGSIVTLKAEPDGAYHFSNWTGDCTSDTLTMNKDMACSAIFTQKVNLSVGTNAGGMVTSYPQGINCGNGKTCSAQFTPSEKVVLSAKSDQGYRFNGWSGYDECNGGKEPNLRIIMNKTKSCNANFIKRYTININLLGGTGKIEGSGLICSGNFCTGTYDSGVTASLLAVPDNGFIFKNWSGDCGGIEKSTSVKVDSDKTCTATFTKTHTLTIGNNCTYRGAPESCNGYTAVKINIPSLPLLNCYINECIYKDVEQGKAVSVHYTMNQNTNYKFNGWSGNCSGTGTSQNLTMNSDKTCHANFAR